MTNYELINWFKTNYNGIYKLMKNCDHNYNDNTPNPWHIEGDIWSHTMLVMNELRNESFEMRLVGLLHDIGKPIVAQRNEGKKRVYFTYHEPISAFMSLDIMNKLGLDNKTKERLFKLIATHTDIFKLSPDKLRKRCKGLQELYDDLHRFGKGDHGGAIRKGIEDVREPIGEVEELSPRKTTKEVVIMIGLPASGKSTYIKEHYPEHLVINRDDIMMKLGRDAGMTDYKQVWDNINHKAVDKILEQQLKDSKMYTKVVVDMTHCGRKSRARSLNWFQGKDWHKTAVVVLPSITELDKRIENRPEQRIPNDVYEQKMKTFMIPTHEEGFDEIRYIL